MPIYTYRAINTDSQEVSGTVEAVSLDAAKQALADMSLEPIELSESMRIRKDPPGMPIATGPAMTMYAFEGLDDKKELHRGTVQAESRRQAFDRLMKDRALTLTSLAPVGIEPPVNDEELTAWQRGEVPALSPQSSDISAPWVQVEEKESSDTHSQPEAMTAPPANDRYHSLFSTIGLYAGWLLAWYGVALALGYYQTVRDVPLEVPFVSGFLASSFIFSMTLALFLYLLLFAVFRTLKGGIVTASALTLIGIVAFLFLRLNALILG